MFQTHFSKRLLALSVSTLSVAAGSAQVTAKEVITLPDTVVTASRVETPIRDVIGDVTVISAEELATHKGQTLAEVLHKQSGIQWKQNGGMGTLSSMFIRGNRGESTLLLVDGIRLGSVSSSSAPFETIAADQIERVEILRGSAATSVYGSDGIGGVIQVFTKAATQTKNTANFTIGAGTHGTRTLSGGFNAGNRQTRFGMNVAHRQTDGINATKPSNTSYFEPDTDGSENLSASIALSHKTGDNFAIGFNGSLSNSLTEIDAKDPKEKTLNDHKANSAAVWTKYNLADVLDIKLQYGITNDENGTATSAFGWNYDSKQELASVQGDYTLPVGQLSFALEKLEQSLDTSAPFKVTDRKIDSLQLGYQFAGKHLQGQFNVRRDDVSDYSTEDTFSAGLALEPLEGVRIGTSYATGFRVPSFNDLFSPFGANPDLKPEHSINKEVFFAVDVDTVTTRLSFFQNNVENLILLDKNWVPQNTTEALLKGVSWRTDWENNNLSAGAHYDYLNATDEATGKRLQNRAKHSGGLYAGVSVSDKLTLRGEVDYVGMRFDDAANTKRLDDYTLFNLVSTVKFNPNIDGSLRWNNVFAEDYETVGGYNSLGANVLASITLHNK